MHDWNAARSHAPGLVLRPELLAGGLDNRGIAAELRQGSLARLRPGAYLVAGDDVPTLTPEQRHQVLARAVLLQSRCAAVLSHTSALIEHGVPVWGVDLGRVHLTRRDEKAGRQHPQVVQHRGEIGPDDIVQRNGLDVTSGTRTALDLCCLLPLEPAVVAIGTLLRAELTTKEQLWARHAELRHRPHSLRTDLAIRLADGRPESIGEWRTLFACWKQQLPLPVPQYVVTVDDREVARLDFAWPDRRVWLEFDGKVKLTQFLRPGETAADAVAREKTREDFLRAHLGWICVRITWDDLQHPERLAAKVRRAFEQAAAAYAGR